MNDYVEDTWYETIAPENAGISPQSGVAGRTNSNILQELKTFQTSRGSNLGGNSFPNSGEYVNVVTSNDAEYVNIDTNTRNASGTNDDYLEPVDYRDEEVYENEINQQMCQTAGLHDEVPSPVQGIKTLPPKKGKRCCGNCCIGICVAVILLLLAGIGGASFFLSKKFLDSPDDQGKQDSLEYILKGTAGVREAHLH